jgi:hypothetical protein
MTEQPENPLDNPLQEGHEQPSGYPFDDGPAFDSELAVLPASEGYYDPYAEMNTFQQYMVVLGFITRGVVYLLMFFIVGNAVFEAFSGGSWLLGLMELAFFPATFFLYPFLAPAGHVAWPLDAGTSLIPALVLCLILYPVSTIIGGRPPIG